MDRYTPLLSVLLAGYPAKCPLAAMMQQKTGAPGFLLCLEGKREAAAWGFKG